MRKAGDILSDLFKKNFGQRFMETARSTSALFSSWPQIVIDEDLPDAAAHSRIRELEHGQLLVEADHPGWVQILRTKQAQLLTLVKRQYPELDVKSITFKLSREA